MCVFCGCDYINSPKGIGLKTAYSYMLWYNNAKEFIENYDKELEPNFLQMYMCAYLAFKYSRVYCPKQEKMVSLNAFEIDRIDKSEPFDYIALKIAMQYDSSFDFLGKKLPDEIA